MKLSGRVAIVTGAARGIGAETARRLASRGATVALLGMEPELLDALQRELGAPHIWAECDVTDQEGLERAVACTAARLGAIDIVVANAGIGCHGTVAGADVEAMARVIDVNLVGVLRTVKATLPYVTARRGYYLLVSSSAAFRATPGMAAYAASKAGIEQFGNVLRLELANTGVDVGVAHMTWVDTDLVRDVQRDLFGAPPAGARSPGSLGSAMSVNSCARAFVNAIEARARTLFLPGRLWRASAFRHFMTSAIAQRAILRRHGPMLRHLETETRTLGRSFGEHSVGMGARDRP